MRSRKKTYKKPILTELAEAISSFNITEVANLLSDNGKFAVPKGNNQVILSDKKTFVDWLSGCYSRFLSSGKPRRRFNFTIVQCLHCLTGNPIIIFDDGSFPVFTDNQGQDERSGFVIISDDNMITGIELCFLVMKTENPFIYEKKCLSPGF
jgi:hypothetical protein